MASTDDPLPERTITSKMADTVNDEDDPTSYKPTESSTTSEHTNSKFEQEFEPSEDASESKSEESSQPTEPSQLSGRPLSSIHAAATTDAGNNR